MAGRFSLSAARSGVTWLRGLGWLVALAVALLVGLWSFAIGNEFRSPARSWAAIPWSPHSAAGGNLAYLLYSARLAENPAAQVSPAEKRMSANAYGADPLAVPALGLLALSMTDEAQQARRRSLLERTGELSRRSSLVNYELVKEAGLRNDDRAFFTWLSRSVLTNNQARTTYLAVMAEATARDGAVAALTPVIGPQPSWAETYWRSLLGKSASLANGARLRIAVAGRPWGQTSISVTDRSLVQRLVGVQEFELARQLAGALGRPGAARADGANLLGKANLARQPELPPFDWQLTALGNLGSSIDSDSRTLTISAIAGARGAAVRRLLHLTPGHYRLGWTLSESGFDSGEMASNMLSADVRCAEQNVQTENPAPVTLLQGKREAALSISDSACRWYWLSILVDIPDDAAGVDAQLRDISLAKSD